jgi:hypothetical protein
MKLIKMHVGGTWAKIWFGILVCKGKSITSINAHDNLTFVKHIYADEVCACLSQTIKCINVELIIRNYSRNNISNVLIRLFETIAITCQIYKWKKENYLLAVVSVALSQRSFPHAQQLHDVCCSLALWQCDTPKFSDLGSSCLLCCPASHANLFSSSTLFHYWHCSSRYTGSFNCFTLMTHQARSSCLDSKDLKSK